MKRGFTTVSEACSLAIHAMVILAQNPGKWHRAEDVSHALKASTHHLQKIFQRLRKLGLIESVTGPGGGHRLAKPAEEITLLDIYQAMEGQLPKKPCLFGEIKCRTSLCPFSDLLEDINGKVKLYLSQKRLSELSITPRQIKETKKRSQNERENKD